MLMLKAIVNILISIAFIFTSSGVVLNSHYCKNRLISTSIYLTPDSCCNGHCNKCHNESKVFKITDNFQGSIFSVNLTQFYNDLFITPVTNCLITFDEISTLTNYFTDTSPPPGSSLTSLLQVFRL